MEKIEFNRQNLINSSDKNKLFLCVMCDLDKNEQYPSFWYGTDKGESFNTLRGTHLIKKNGDGYYNHYKDEPTLVARVEDSKILTESMFWQLADFDSIPEWILKPAVEKRHYYPKAETFEFLIKNNHDVISSLLEDIHKRGTLKRNLLM